VGGSWQHRFVFLQNQDFGVAERQDVGRGEPLLDGLVVRSRAQIAIEIIVDLQAGETSLIDEGASKRAGERSINGVSSAQEKERRQ
jgi:hypothetical protein